MDIYTINLTLLLTLCGALFFRTKTLSPSSLTPANLKSNPLLPFYAVYTLVMASDWLQGPFLYSLYRDEHAVSPSLIPSLFTTGFLSGAASGSVIGSWADKNGRKNACLLFCAIYAASCILTTLPGGSIPLLFLGRVLGGIGTSLLFTVFESWMVADVKSKSRPESELSKTFGVMSTLNSLVAIASGVASEWLVTATGTKKSPFWASAALLLLAAGIISSTWKENYATPTPSTPSKTGGSKKTTGSSSKSPLSALISPKILALALTTTLFEGSMYLFVFFWAPALLSLPSRTQPQSSSSSSSLPFGIIFSSFMASTLLSSLSFASLTARISHSALLTLLLASSSILFLLSASPSTQQSAFWVFCLFEGAVGLYFPAMGVLKGKMIDDAVRARIYGFLRIPLNVFVVGALVLTRDAGEEGFGKVFTACSGLLAVAAGVVGVVMRREGEEKQGKNE
ncbi:major facilitator superfamily transporter domain-containing protein 5 [Cladorrhinum samala]|uniref:Molybdate-anion transporter n=1 Tax=Cladorrhinum samala TaxID=585594 RepID=A0AAV9HCY9_9PEZI|nr:major facilitator superfamily transporter domain-containing protein 5 [Cladorrhinum samala]